MRCGALCWGGIGGGAEVASVADAVRHLPPRGCARRRGDALLGMSKGMLVIELNIVHAPAVTYLQGTVAAGVAAEVDGAAAAMGEHNKEEEYHRDLDCGAYNREPVVMESGGRRGKGAVRVVNRLAKIAADSHEVEKHVFLRRVQDALSMAQVQGNGWVWKKELRAMAYGG